MTFDQLLDYMYEHHRIRRQKDIAIYFGVTTQSISNWKRTNNVPSKYAIKLQVTFPTNYIELVESLTEVIITLNKDIKALQSINRISEQYFSDGEFYIKNGKPIVPLTHIEGDWLSLSGYTIEETLNMNNIINVIQLIDDENVYLARMNSIDLTEATHDGYWTFKHKSGKIFKIHGTSLIDYKEKKFKCAFSAIK